MDKFDANDLTVLTSPSSGQCVSVFLATHPAGEASQQDRTRLKNLLDQAEEQLVAAGTRPATARDLLQPARQLPDDPAYWSERSQGLAIFIGPDSQRRYRLPLVFEDLVYVGERFILRPLLPLLDGENRFFILSLSQNKVQLFEADQQRIEAREISSLPSSMEKALNYSSVDRGSQAHSAMQGRLGKQSAVFHGQGGEPDTHKAEVESFFRMVDAAIHPLLVNERTPLLLAGVEYLLPIYRRVNRNRNVVDVEVHGNCDYLTPHEIHERAWHAVEPVLGQARREAATHVQRGVATDKSLCDLRKILVAAREGRVEALFIDQAVQCWGIVRPDSQEVQIHKERRSGDDDLLDLAAVETLRHAGKVYVVPRGEMPVKESNAALLRY